jgi:uncharacterized C2H2 Zn-finger protein
MLYVDNEYVISHTNNEWIKIRCKVLYSYQKDFMRRRINKNLKYLFLL